MVKKIRSQFTKRYQQHATLHDAGKAAIQKCFSAILRRHSHCNCFAGDQSSMSECSRHS